MLMVIDQYIVPTDAWQLFIIGHAIVRSPVHDLTYTVEALYNTARSSQDIVHSRYIMVCFSEIFREYDP